MSYDLHLFRPPPGADLREAGLHSFRFEGDGPATPQSEARKRALADVLLAHDPRLVLLPPDDVPRPESAVPPPLELVTDDGAGIHVDIFDLTVSVSLPYARGEGAWGRVRGYVRVLEAAGGFRAFDPQTMDVLDLDVMPSAADAEGYQRGNAVVQRILDRSDERRPSAGDDPPA